MSLLDQALAQARTAASASFEALSTTAGLTGVGVTGGGAATMAAGTGGGGVAATLGTATGLAAADGAIAATIAGAGAVAAGLAPEAAVDAGVAAVVLALGVSAFFTLGLNRFANQGQLGGHASARTIELQGLAIRLTGQPGVHITQVLMGSGVTGVGADGHFQRCPRLLELALARVQHRQVVVWLGQLGVVFRQLDEGDEWRPTGFARRSRQDHAFEKTHLGIARLAVPDIASALLNASAGLARFPQQGIDLAVVVRMHC
jgi:hypothetical protein